MRLLEWLPIVTLVAVQAAPKPALESISLVMKQETVPQEDIMMRLLESKAAPLSTTEEILPPGGPIESPSVSSR